jgi:rSAM/selenodomain-associated transferase 1
VLGLFAKWPVPGMVKTRLADGHDPTWGARVGHAFLLDTIQRLAVVDAQRVLAFAPREREADFAAVAGCFALIPQGDGDLGQRLAAFVDQQLDEGARAVVLVGTDSPTLPVAHVELAFQALEQADVVLGPACDGGYYLLGCGPRRPPVFENISWSTGRVLSDTVAALADPRWRLAMLPPWYDVDTLVDWAMLCGHVAALRRAGVDPGVPHTEALFHEAAPSEPSYSG